MKLHESKCHFREVPQAVTKYGLRRRPRTRPSSSIKFWFTRTSTRTSTKSVRFDRLNLPLYETAACPEQLKELTSNIERPTSNIEYWWRYALSFVKKANRSLRRAQPNRISKGRFALGLRSLISGVGLLSVFFNWQNSLFDVGRSMFDVRPARNALKSVWGKFNHVPYK